MRYRSVIIPFAMLFTFVTVHAGTLVRVGAQEPWQRVGIASKPTLDSDGFLFTVNPTKDPHTNTGYFIPSDIESAVHELNKMLPADLQEMIVNKLMASDAFDCDVSIYPKCFQGYYTSLDDYLEHIWELKQDSAFARYFQVHQIDNPAIMIDITMQAFRDTHLHKPIDYDKLFRRRDDRNQSQKQ